MHLLVNREIKSSRSTIGHLSVNGVVECFCLEPIDRGLTSTMSLHQILLIKMAGQTAVPTGTYPMDWYFSPKHGICLPRVLNVPGFLDAEIHAGNYPSDTEGCLLLGTSRNVDMVLNSRAAIAAFYPKFEAAFKAGEIIDITYQ